MERCAYRLSAPGLGQEVGANLGLMPALYQGFFLAPSVVSGAVKGAVFVAACYEKLGFTVVPSSKEARHDIIQCVELGSPEGMVAFCKGIQSAAPVDSYVDPVPGDMPGYDSQVIMAAGAFVQGSSIELSADGPVREPYAVYYQGGLTWYHAKLGILMSLQKLVDAGNTVLVIEHNLDIIKAADRIIDLGPEGGDGGGTVVAYGTPEQVAKNEESHTARFLRKLLSEKLDLVSSV